MNYRLSARASQVLLGLVLTRHHEDQFAQAEFAKTAGLSKHVAYLALLELGQVGLIDSIPWEVGHGQVEVAAIPEAAPIIQTVDGTSEVEEEPDPLERCRLADKSGDRKEKKAALVAVWEEAFPLPTYEYSQLSNSFASWLTQDGRKAEWVGGIIQKIGHTGKYIESPVGYVRSTVERMEAEQANQAINEKQIEITADLWGLVEAGREYFGHA